MHALMRGQPQIPSQLLMPRCPQRRDGIGRAKFGGVPTNSLGNNPATRAILKGRQSIGRCQISRWQRDGDFGEWALCGHAESYRVIPAASSGRLHTVLARLGWTQPKGNSCHRFGWYRRLTSVDIFMSCTRQSDMRPLFASTMSCCVRPKPGRRVPAVRSTTSSKTRYARRFWRIRSQR